MVQYRTLRRLCFHVFLTAHNIRNRYSKWHGWLLLIEVKP